MGIKDNYFYKKVRKCYYALKNWNETKDNMKIKHRIKKYKNIYKGKACVIIGNGPSLRVEDLEMLYSLKIPTFACNRINLIFSQTKWRPTYYFMSDGKLIAQYKDDIEGVSCDHRFFPKSYRDTIKNGVFYNTLWFDYENEGKFSLNAAEGVYAACSVTTEMIQFAYYMGFAEIYLIGVDFSYSINNKVDNQSYSYNGEDNYFIKGYLKPGEIADMPNIRANVFGFNAAKQAIEGQGRIIRNATRGGKLEVFERVDLDDLFKKWKEDVK